MISTFKANILRVSFLGLTLSLMTGCALVPEDAQFGKVAEQVEGRTGLTTVWQVGTPRDSKIKARIQDLLKSPLTVISTTQVALLNSPALQEKYADLGISQADLIQAGLLINPSFGAVIGFSKDGKITDLDFNLIFNFLSILVTPLRKAVAESKFQETQLTMVKITLDLASQTRKAYYQAVATHQLKGFYQQVIKSAEVSYLAAKSLRDAGNISALQLVQIQGFYEQSRADYLEVESTYNQSFEHLKRLMGLSSSDAILHLEATLSDPENDREILEQSIESILGKNIDLAFIKQRLETHARQYHITNITALIPELKVGASTKYQSKEWDYGPSVEFVIPLFDQGQPAIARALFEIHGIQKSYANMSIYVQSMTRSLQDKITKARKRAIHLKNTLLPLNQKILDETQRHYNAMQVGLFDLLQAKQNQIEGKRKLIQALLGYWSARSDLEQLVQGSLPGEGQIRLGFAEKLSSTKDLDA